MRYSERRVLTSIAVAGILALGSGCGGEGPEATQGGTQVEKPAEARQAAKAKRSTVLTVAAQTSVPASLQSGVDTGKNQVGDRVTLRTTADVRVEGAVAIPAGSTVHGKVTHVKSAGRIKGAAELTLRFHEVVLPNGKTLEMTCEPFRIAGKGDGRESAAEIGGGAAAGGLLGGVLGGKDDILKGAAVGAVVGTGVAVATKGEQIVLPAGQTIRIQLASPLTIAPQVAS